MDNSQTISTNLSIMNKESKCMHIAQPVKKWYTNINSPYSCDTVDLCSVAVLDSELEILIVVGTQICSVDSTIIKIIIVVGLKRKEYNTQIKPRRLLFSCKIKITMILRCFCSFF